MEVEGVAVIWLVQWWCQRSFLCGIRTVRTDLPITARFLFCCFFAPPFFPCSLKICNTPSTHLCSNMKHFFLLFLGARVQLQAWTGSPMKRQVQIRTFFRQLSVSNEAKLLRTMAMPVIITTGNESSPSLLELYSPLLSMLFSLFPHVLLLSSPSSYSPFFGATYRKLAMRVNVPASFPLTLSLSISLVGAVAIISLLQLIIRLPPL